MMIKTTTSSSRDCSLSVASYSQLESVKGNVEGIQIAEALTEPIEKEVTEISEGGEKEAKSKNEGGGGGGESDKEEMVKELKSLKRQNTITHWLLSVMIVLTVAWQASEVAMLLKVKHGLSHPLSYVGSVFSSLFSGGSDQAAENEKQKNDTFTSLKMPELPSVELPDIGLHGKKHKEIEFDSFCFFE
ncbi:uncharacterized protein LOC126792017 isoform X2 [Argentina anserina]|uniref:uncharacterized protein LOC126792017 isoform X2 n=1 Tax=Argentina anserina TaxID=57926 RepID=UPI002176849C|nr:uncharacterized protein LOC126792017 isoform X2 [Potentilla anserina]